MYKIYHRLCDTSCCCDRIFAIVFVCSHTRDAIIWNSRLQFRERNGETYGKLSSSNMRDLRQLYYSDRYSLDNMINWKFRLNSFTTYVGKMPQEKKPEPTVPQCSFYRLSYSKKQKNVRNSFSANTCIFVQFFLFALREIPRRYRQSVIIVQLYLFNRSPTKSLLLTIITNYNSSSIEIGVVQLKSKSLYSNKCIHL